jgi:hypothetical protein
MWKEGQMASNVYFRGILYPKVISNALNSVDYIGEYWFDI